MSGGGAGSIQHMITSLRNNKNLLKQVNHFQKQENSKLRHSEHIEVEFKHATEEELNAFKLELKKKIKIQTFKNGLALAISFLLTIVIILLIYRGVFL